MSEKQDPNAITKEFSVPFNYIYFGILFFALGALQIYHLLLIGTQDPLIRNLYIIYAVLESFVEIILFSWISLWLLSKGKRKIHYVYISLVSALFFCRIIDFAIVRLMDLSVWYWIAVVSQETLPNFIEMLYASSFEISGWITVFLSLAIAILSTCSLFYFSDKLARLKPVFLSSKKCFGLLILSFLMLVAGDLFLYNSQDFQHSLKYTKALPWKRTLFDVPEEPLVLNAPLKGFQSGISSIQAMDSDFFSLERKPDLFLFVAESLRDDFLVEEITPHLTKFRGENTHFKKALSNGNSTVHSWFSLFYSMYPFYWTQSQETLKNGSSPLALLKKMGYETHVYASSRLQYYQMDKVLFSDIQNLHEFRVNDLYTSSETDKMAIDKLCEDIQASDQKGGRLFIVFLDATHFDYSWPADKQAHFQPITERIDYLDLICERKNLEHVKNRYKNALSYLDELFDSFQKTLKQKGLWKESVVVFTADHGEDFDKFGCVFHASKFSKAQLQIPLYIKLGEDQIALSLDTERKASQMDIFPTLLHYLMGENTLAPAFQGSSLFGVSSKNYVIGTGYNASLPPREFYIQSGPYMATFEFGNKGDIFHSKSLKVKSIQDEKGDIGSVSLDFVKNHFEEPLNALFSLR